MYRTRAVVFRSWPIKFASVMNSSISANRAVLNPGSYGGYRRRHLRWICVCPL